jgi:hypothetical protein
MRRPTMGYGPRGTIRIIDTHPVIDRVVSLAVRREWPTSRAAGPRAAHRSQRTNPVLTRAKSSDRILREGWCRLLQNRSNEPTENLGKVCGRVQLVAGFRRSVKTEQTNPILPEWQSDRLVVDTRNEQTNPILPEWQYLAGFTIPRGARTNPTGRRSHSRCRASEATGPTTRSGVRDRGHRDGIGARGRLAGGGSVRHSDPRRVAALARSCRELIGLGARALSSSRADDRVLPVPVAPGRTIRPGYRANGVGCDCLSKIRTFYSMDSRGRVAVPCWPRDGRSPGWIPPEKRSNLPRISIVAALRVGWCVRADPAIRPEAGRFQGRAAESPDDRITDAADGRARPGGFARYLVVALIFSYHDRSSTTIRPRRAGPGRAR